MNKKILIGIAIIIFLIISVLIIRIVSKNDSSKQLELTYDINAGIPFKWEVEVEDESVVKYVKNYVIEDKNKGGITGGKISRNYVFKGLKEGTTTVTFKYVNFTNNKVEKEEKHTVKVDKDLNISLVGIPVEQ
jgi:predicted secreted protein